MGTSRACITNNIAQNYSDGEEKNRDPVEVREPSGVEQLGEGWALLSKIYSLRFSPLGLFDSTPLCSIPFCSLWFSSIYSFVKGIFVASSFRCCYQSRMKMQGHLSLSSDHIVAVQRQIKNNGAVLLCRQKKPSALLYLQVRIIYHVSEAKFTAMLSLIHLPKHYC